MIQKYPVSKMILLLQSSCLINFSQFQKTGSPIQKTGAADSHCLGFSDHMADCFPIFYSYMVNGAFAAPHTTGDLRSFKGWSCRCRTGDQPVSVSQNQLSVCSNVHQQRHFFTGIQIRCHQTSHSICAYKTADIGKPPKLRPGMYMNVIPGSHKLLRFGNFRRIGRQSQRISWNPQKQVMHTGISHHNNSHNILRVPSRPFCQLS